MKNLYGETLFIQRTGKNYEIMVTKKWGKYRAYNEFCQHETFATKQDAKIYLKANRMCLA